MRQIILASSSPRRKELLQNIGLTFRVVPSKIDEKLNPRLKVASQVEQLSLQKAEAVAPTYPDAIIIAADTLVAIDQEILAKPSSRDDAVRMLRKLNGKMHIVVTGFTIMDTKIKKQVTKSETTKLFMRRLTEKEVESYVKKENRQDTAGGYAMHLLGAVLFEKIEGDYFNVIGLPIPSLVRELKKFKLDVL